MNAIGATISLIYKRYPDLINYYMLNCTKVDYFKSVVVVEKQIFWLQVTVTDTAFVQVLNSGYQLPVEFRRLLLGKPGVSNDVVEQLASIGVLHDHVQLFVCFDNLQILI